MTSDLFSVRGKIMAPDEWEGLLSDRGGRSSSLVEFGNGRNTTTKSASECFGRNMLADLKPDDKHFLVHYVAMGASETYGFNRNGDGFKRAALIERHPTFVSHAHYFREHRNHDPAIAIGRIKAAAYNHAMDRVEVIVEGCRTKAAAEYEKAVKGEEISGSMACRIPFDVCSCCGKQSKRASEYCTHVGKNMTRYLPEFGKYAYVDNPEPTFIDYSSVARPADRIAHYIRYMLGDENVKAASAEPRVINGADWAAFYSGETHPDVKIAGVLSRLSGAADRTAFNDPADMLKRAFAGALESLRTEELSDRDIDELRKLRPATLWRKLASASLVLPFNSFCAYLLDRKIADISGDQELKSACCMLSMMPSWLSSCGMDMARGLIDQFKPCGCREASEDPADNDMIDRILEKAEDKFGIEEIPVRGRLIRATVIKHAADANQVELPVGSDGFMLAAAYTLYKAAALDAIEQEKGVSEGRLYVVANHR